MISPVAAEGQVYASFYGAPLSDVTHVLTSDCGKSRVGGSNHVSIRIPGIYRAVWAVMVWGKTVEASSCLSWSMP